MSTVHAAMAHVRSRNSPATGQLDGSATDARGNRFSHTSWKSSVVGELSAALVSRLGDDTDVDAATAERICLLHANYKKNQEHEKHNAPVSACPPFYVKPISRAFWMPESFGGGSSYFWVPEERTATINDLVLDLALVYVLSTCAHAGARLVSGGSDGSHGGAAEPCHHNTSTTPAHTPASGGDDSNDWLKTHPEALSMVIVGSIFLPCWIHWKYLASVNNSYSQHDTIHMLKFGVELVLLTALASSVHGCIFLTECWPFIWTLVVSKLFLIACLQFYRRANHALFSYSLNSMSLVLLLEVVLWSLTAVYEDKTPDALGSINLAALILWWVAVITPLVLQWGPAATAINRRFTPCVRLLSACSTDHKHPAPVHIPLLVERNHLFTIICVGELAVAVLGKYDGGLFAVPAILQIVLFVVIRFEVLDDTEHHMVSGRQHKREHATMISETRGLAYSLFHGLTCYGILIVALGLLENDKNKISTSDYAFCHGCFIISLGVTLRHALHREPPGIRVMPKHVRLAIRFALSLIFLIVPMLPWESQTINGERFVSVTTVTVYEATVLAVMLSLVLVSRCGGRLRSAPRHVGGVIRQDTIGELSADSTVSSTRNKGLLLQSLLTGENPDELDGGAKVLSDLPDAEPPEPITGLAVEAVDAIIQDLLRRKQDYPQTAP